MKRYIIPEWILLRLLIDSRKTQIPEGMDEETYIAKELECPVHEIQRARITLKYLAGKDLQLFEEYKGDD